MQNKKNKKNQQTLDNISFNRQSTSRNNLDSKDSIKWTFHFFDWWPGKNFCCYVSSTQKSLQLWFSSHKIHVRHQSWPCFILQVHFEWQLPKVKYSCILFWWKFKRSYTDLQDGYVHKILEWQWQYCKRLLLWFKFFGTCNPSRSFASF